MTNQNVKLSTIKSKLSKPQLLEKLAKMNLKGGTGNYDKCPPPFDK